MDNANALHESDVYALLTDIRDSLRSDGYELTVRSVAPQISLAIDAGPDACEDCLVGKDLMSKYVVAALSELDQQLDASDIAIAYPGEGSVPTDQGHEARDNEFPAPNRD